MGGGVMGGGQPRSADRPMPRYRPAPEYPPLPDYLPLPATRRPPAIRRSRPPIPMRRRSGLASAARYPPCRHLAVRGHPPVPD